MKSLTNQLYESLECDNIDESIRIKKVVRDGKIIIKKYTNRPGYKVVDGREVKISSQEAKNRRLAAKKSHRKRRSTNKNAVKRRHKSMLIRSKKHL